jgi:predicted transcriptional regulator of viral defense system
MRFDELLEIVGDEPVFTSSLLRAGDVSAVDLASQLSRWVAGGRLLSLRRGVYLLAAPYRHRDPHPFEIANVLVRPSYVSLESALSFHGLIPETVFATTSVTTAAPSTFDTVMGRFDFRHMSPRMLWGYSATPIVADVSRTALVARPEKALLDLVYLRARADTTAFLRQMRLDRLDTLDLDVLEQDARRIGTPKALRAARAIAGMVASPSEEWEAL